MTERESLEAEDRKRYLISRLPLCCVCHKHASMQLAHRIPQAKWAIAKWGKAVIHHSFNLVPVCGLGCNAAVLLTNQPVMQSALVSAIEKEMNGEKEIARDILSAFDFRAREAFR